ncbi:MAG: hypothetical protein A2270_11490 [Elusimicrobia bacterium RIFOXYA12_FULL_51_18]|nr:MAG: hypothetical protein A2270_11490 [Elusimicrobia bacterium RIFOXYA12_FULL_51_18]OGS30359.1 MAG: hypothetical protein A2218_01725 [Elusimicrobia bacterium RIFOXYA2_FULL_53_38]
MELQAFKKTPDDDCVEAEIVSGPGTRNSADQKEEVRSGRRGRSNNYGAPRHARQTAGGSASGGNHGAVNIPFYGLFQRIKLLFITATLLISFALIVIGLLLTSTIIGAIIGVPLIILGGILLWILFRLLTFGQKGNTMIFPRF